MRRRSRQDGVRECRLLNPGMHPTGDFAMSKPAITLALAAAALVAGCAYRATPAPTPVVVVPQQPPPAVVHVPAGAPAVVAQPTAVRAGFGRIESIAAVPGTTSGALRRLGVKMGDGTVQYVDSEAPNVAIGDRVELTTNGYLRHPI
jgi:hypothetical protein